MADGLSRRDMIKGAAVAGAAAWTAPMIIDSLTSPAAAASSCGPGTPNLSYGIVVYKSGSTYYSVKVAGNTCTSTTDTGGDIAGDLNYNCPGTGTFTNPGGTITLNGVALTAGNCANITIHNSSGWVSANNGVTIVFAFAHDGSLTDHFGCFFCSTGTCATIC